LAKYRWLFLLPVVASVLLLFQADPAQGWQLYTHNFTGGQALADAVDDGNVTIDGREYPVPPEVVTALRDWPEFYNAGVIGPDGFPDLTYGLTVIHPAGTGEWLRLIFTQAWAAQSDASYTDPQKSQILAFAYGYLTHAAGDMWAHTLVNDFTRGVYPDIPDVFTDVDMAEIALRHIILEVYLRDPTPGLDGAPGWDGNDDRGPAPGGDVSDVNTPGVDLPQGPAGLPEGDTEFDGVRRFIFETLIDPSAQLPGDCGAGVNNDPLKDAVADDGCPGGPATVGDAEPIMARGPVIDFFLGLRGQLADFLAAKPYEDLAEAITDFDHTQAQLEAVGEDCNFDGVVDAAHDAIWCPIALAGLAGAGLIDSFEAFLAFAEDTLDAALHLVFNSYVAAWIDDIDFGLEHWGELGLAVTRAFGDPQALRDLQNEECQFEGSEDSLNRANCEDGVGQVDLVLNEADPFINAHLLSMLGAPDIVGVARDFIMDFSETLDEILGPALAIFNPIEETLAEIEEFAGDLIKDMIKDWTSIDLEAFESFSKHPTAWLEVDQISMTLPFLGTTTVDLFAEGEHERLDAIMGLGPDHHVVSDPPYPGFPFESTRLADDAEWSPDTFAPLKNTITTAKLLLLSDYQLNQVLTDILGRTIQTYGDGQNIMIDALNDPEAWLRMIDGDHAWRADGLPVFCPGGSKAASTSCAGSRPAAIARGVDPSGGNGEFPIWESCVLRPAFRTLYADWENGADDFPDLGDAVSADPASDPNAPTSALARSGAFYDNGVNQFVGADNVFTLTAHDTPAGMAYADSELQLQYRIYSDPLSPGPFIDAAQGTMFSLAGPDGRYFIDIRSGDPCHTVDDSDSLSAEAAQSFEFILDATPPVVTCDTPPFGLTFDTDDFSNVDYEIDDGPLGSGVASSSSTIDGFLVLPGIVPIADGDALDMFKLYPNVRTVAVTATDNIGNTGTTNCTFEIHATTDSLISNLFRARSEGLILGPPKVFQSFLAKLTVADAAHDVGKHDVEHLTLIAYRDQLLKQRGKGIDAVTADRFIAYINDLIATGG
jgi:hypothetical protein